MRISPLCGVVISFALLAGTEARAEVVTLTPIADTCLWELDPDFNFGRQGFLAAGAIGNNFPADGERSRVLYKFDVANALPDGAVIESARLRIRRWDERLPLQRGVSDFALSRILVDWGEGDNLGEFPGGREADDPGEATWINRMHPSIPWSVPGGAFGVDFASEQSAFVEDVDSNLTYLLHFNAIGLADVQAMAEGTVENYGWVLHALDETTLRTARHWTSRESDDEGLPPDLQITYTLPTPPIPEIDVALDEAAEELVVLVEAVGGYRYQVETSDDLIDWTPGELQDPAMDIELIFRVPITGSTLFVRVAASDLPPPG